MDDKKLMETTSNKLNLLAGLLIDIKQLLGEKMSIKEKVEYLVRRGITDDEDMSAILGITRGHASKEKAMLKKNG
ncbi:MAG: hypothetical protein AABX70_05880 [Nanoarchaeota archaeon]